LTPLVSLRATLAEHRWFAGAGDDVLDALAATGRPVTFARGTQLFARGENGDRLLLVQAGVVKISSVSLEGREMVLSFVHGGEFLGEIAALDGGPRTADATALTAVTAYSWTRGAFLAVMRAHPDFALRVVKLLCARLRQTNVMVESAVQLPRSARIARGLSSLLKTAGRETADGWRLDFKLSQRDLAAYVGLARENVNRQLRQWENLGLVRLERGEVVVRDRAALEELGEVEAP
jgi:CRP-like cAMP-binding protein